MEKTITPIDFNEASLLLGITVNGIHKALKRGMLIRIPSTGQKTHLIKEQVNLFIGKPQLRKDLLSEEELKTWKYYNMFVNTSDLSIDDIDYTDNILNEQLDMIEQEINKLSNLLDKVRTIMQMNNIRKQQLQNNIITDKQPLGI